MDDAIVFYRDAMERGDTLAATQRFAEDIVVHVAVHDQPVQGREATKFLFGVLGEIFEHFTVTRIFHSEDGREAVLLFDVHVGGRAAQGMNHIVAEDDDGDITELVVMFRPLQVLQQIAETVGPRMAAEFGDLGISEGRTAEKDER